MTREKIAQGCARAAPLFIGIPSSPAWSDLGLCFFTAKFGHALAPIVKAQKQAIVGRCSSVSNSNGETLRSQRLRADCSSQKDNILVGAIVHRAEIATCHRQGTVS